MKKVIKNISGFVLAFGLDEKLITNLNNNHNIEECILLDNYTKKEKKAHGIKGNNISIKKLRKKFKKKRVDYIICNYEVIQKYLNTFIKDSVFINKNKIYFYNVTDHTLLKKYSRYNAQVIINKNYIEIDTSNSKNNFIKDLYYSVLDFGNKMIDIIGDILMG